MFHYNGPDCNENPEECPNKLNYYNNYASDNNNLLFSEPQSIEDRENSCAVQRRNKAVNKNKNTFVGLNNFVTPSNVNEVGKMNAINDAERLNEYYAIKDYVDSCADIIGTDINFVLNDWWGEGELIRLTQDHNSARALGDSYDPPTPAPTMNERITKSPTTFPTFFPTKADETDEPTVSMRPSFPPSASPTGRPDPCPDFNGDCKACRVVAESCLWCASTAVCYNRFVFENIFDLDDEIIPCQGEDVVSSFDFSCNAPSRPQQSLYDDVVTIDDDDFDSNYTAPETSSPSSSPTKAPAEPPSLPPIFVPLSPPTAIEATSNVFNNIFGSTKDSSGALSNTFASTVTTTGLFIVLLLLIA